MVSWPRVAMTWISRYWGSGGFVSSGTIAVATAAGTVTGTFTVRSKNLYVRPGMVSVCWAIPELSGNVNVTALCGGGGKGPRSCRERLTALVVTLVTVVPGATRPWTGSRIMPTAMPCVPPSVKFSVWGWAVVLVPDFGFRVSETNGGASAKVTDAGELDMGWDSVTLVVLFATTTVSSGMPVPETCIPSRTPAVSVKCRTMRSLFTLVAGELVVRLKAEPGALARPLLAAWPMNDN